MALISWLHTAGDGGGTCRDCLSCWPCANCTISPQLRAAGHQGLLPGDSWSIPNLDSQSLAASIWKTPARPGLGSPCITGIGNQVRLREALSLPGTPQVGITRHGSQTLLMSPGGKNHCWLRSLWVRVLHTRKPLGPTVTCLQSVWTDRSPRQKSGSQETLLASMWRSGSRASIKPSIS